MKSTSIAIVGMAGRFPGARTTAEFWRNLRDGVESIHELSDAELREAGALAADLANSDYVRRAAILDGVPLFDAAFFGFSPRDAAIMDPQHRHFLECAWEALEDAAHPPQLFSGAIGVFAGSGMNTYLVRNLLANRQLLASAGLFQLKQTGNDKDVLATRVSYQLDLRGPSVTVQTACSTSLVAVHMACQSLLNFECDMALAGGVTIEIPHGLGYVYREGEILARDGRCRPFDAAASGTVFSSGLGVVVLRRLEDAQADRDHIYAVILGSAINNDGARKAGFLAPSVEGQAEVIGEAIDFAGVGPETIGYVEAHGTGTRVGDPIEVRALAQAFGKSSSPAASAGRTAIGSLKSNIGHLDAAAGVAGLIKAALALEHARIPPTLHFEKINPLIELAGSPFYVNSHLSEWPATGTPRRAGVTSLGIGGTNAHVVLEQAPAMPLTRQPRPFEILLVSAKTTDAADRAFTHLAAHIKAHPELSLADAAFTSQVGRAAFPHRRACIVEDTREAAAALLNLDRKKLIAGTAAQPEVVFLFSGQGSQYVNMGRELYDHEAVFRNTLDECARLLRQPLGIDLIAALYPDEAETEACAGRLQQTWLTQPTIFAVEYALAQWWISLGVKPAAMAGHSIGEYVAACLAQVFSLEDALAIVAARGRMIYELPAGAMLAVPLAAEKIELPTELSLAAINHPTMSVVSGPEEPIAAFEASLARQSIASRRLTTSHAFHSSMMEPVLGAFAERLRGVTLHAPAIPYLSNVTGTWIKPGEATNPDYWARHIRSTVRFSDNLAELLRSPGRVLVETGPGNVLTTLARQQGGAAVHAFPSLPHPRENISALRCALEALGRLWTLGVNIDWPQLHAPDSVQRVPLPTYPFERKKFWIEPDGIAALPATVSTPDFPASCSGLALYRRKWMPAPLSDAPESLSGSWLLFRDALGVADRIAIQLKLARQEVIVVEPGSSYKPLKFGRCMIRPAARADYDALVADLIRANGPPRKIIHLWPLTPPDVKPKLNETLDRCFFSPLYLVQALAAQDLDGFELTLVSNQLQQVGDEAVRLPARAVLLGLTRVLHKELPGFTAKAVDLDSAGKSDCAAQLIAEMNSAKENATIAWRNGKRYAESLAPFSLDNATSRPQLARGGVYLMTGGTGALGLAVAAHLASQYQARLVLIGRTALPAEDRWDAALADATRSEAEKDRIRKLGEIRTQAGGLLVFAADIADRGQMKTVVDAARLRFGHIDGVFHAAGVLDDGPLMTKSAERAARVLAPKLRGTLVLDEALAGETLSCFVLFSSISAILPPAGQVDYAAANAFLDAFALSRGNAVKAIDWGAWSGIGMAARGANSHPWLDEKLLDTPDAIVYASRFSQQRRWVLAEHKYKNGIALIPGTGLMEMAAGAFARGSREGAIEFREVFFLAPLMFAPRETKEVRVELRREAEAGSGAYRFSIFARDDRWTEHSTGIVAPCGSAPTGPIDRAAIATRCRQHEILFDDEHRTRQERQFEFGPRWRSLRRLITGKGEALAEIALDASLAADTASLRQHPALLDMATGAALYLTGDYEHSTDLFLPISYRRMRVYRGFPARIWSHIRTRGETSHRGEIESFDVTIFDEHGQAIAEIEGFAMRRIANAAGAMEESGSAYDAARAGGREPLAITPRAGIAPHEGVRMLTQLLSVQTPATVAVVAQPLDEPPLDEPATEPQPATTASGSEDIEAALAGWWRELLGVGEVNPDDDFFALGGHSLIGVRLFAKIKKHYRVDLELATLFEARTLRQLAAVIRNNRAAMATLPRQWSALVPIQPEGRRTPLFCVHAVGGDVIFYEQLAKALGPEQPFYAFQSPLIAAPDRRDLTVEEMAALYIREMRAFLPQGPYLLGAASYGGLVLYEMARQLYAQGITPSAVIFFDVDVPGSGQYFGAGAKLARFWSNLREDGLRYLRQKAREKSQYFQDLLRDKIVYPLGVRWCKLVGRPLSAPLRFYWISQGHWRALAQYQFKPFPGKVTLVRATDRGPEVLGRVEDPTLGWGALALGGVEVIDVPTQHMLMLFEPYVEDFAQTLKSILPS